MQLHVTVTTSPGLRNFEGVGGYGEGGGLGGLIYQIEKP